MTRARIVAAASTVALGAALAACSTILGFESVTLDPGDGGGASDGGAGDGSPADALPSDAPAPDATADAPPDACGDTMTDPLNCGRCGHSCFKGMCKMGVCQPFALATGYLDTRDLAVDGTSVYFTNQFDNNVYKVSKFDGSNAVKVADSPDAFSPYAIAVDATHVYWTNRASPGGEVRKCALAGCGGQVSTLVATVDDPTALLLVGSNLLWAANTGGVVAGVGVDGGSPFTLFVTDAGASPYQMANDPSYVYFTDNLTGMTHRVPLDGGATIALGNNSVPNSSGIAVGGGSIYFAGGGVTDGVLWRIAASQFANGATATPYASTLRQPAGVAVDADYVYWVNTGAADQNDGSVMACPLTGCQTPITLATGQHFPVRIKLDADAVYWTNNGQSVGRDGSVWKVAKP